MYRGETVRTIMKGFPVPVSDIAQLCITYQTGSRVLLEKWLDSCEVGDDYISFQLTQEESLYLTCGDIERCVVIVTKDGQRYESEPDRFVCLQTSKDGVVL